LLAIPHSEMKIIDFKAFRGPSLYHPEAALVMRLEPGTAGHQPILTFPQALPILSNALAGLQLKPDATLIEVVQSVALQLNQIAGLALTLPLQCGAPARKPADFIALPCFSKRAASFLLQTAFNLVKAAVEGQNYPLSPALLEANQILKKTGMSFNTIAIIQAAIKRGIPWTRLPRPNSIQLGYGKNRRVLQSSWTDRTSLLAAEIASQKHLTKKLLQKASLPVPRGWSVQTEERALEVFRKIGGPVAVKPSNGKQGQNVALSLSSEETVKHAYQAAAANSEHVVVEEYLEGRDFRVLVIGGKFTAAVEREPAHVTGNGIHSVAELVEIENQNPMRGDGHTSCWCRIRFEQEEIRFLETQGWDPGDVPEYGQKVFLRKSANGSAGGTSRDVTEEVHPHFREICEKAARVIGLDICGVDMIAPDISEPGGRCWILEVNHRPGLQPHLHPTYGKARNVAENILDLLFPADSPFGIPIISILGGYAHFPVAQAISENLRSLGIRVGLARQAQDGNSSAAAILMDPIHEAAVIQLGVPEILAHGLPYDHCDLAILMESKCEQEPALRLIFQKVRDGGIVAVNFEAFQSLDFLESCKRDYPNKNILMISKEQVSTVAVPDILRAVHGF